MIESEHSAIEAIKKKFKKIRISKIDDIINQRSATDEEFDFCRKRYKEAEK